MVSLRSLLATAAIALVQTSQAWNVELPPCLSSFQPYVYVGCFSDPGSPDALIFRSPESQYSMTVEECVAECKGNGFRYAGLEYYGVCYCGGTVNGPQVDDSQCTFPCTGNSSETCGGDNLLSVWADPTFDTGVHTIADYQSLGCYTDGSSSGRTLSWQMDLPDSTMTPSICLSACQAEGFPLAGLEYAGECWCGNVLANYTTQVATSQCNMPCKGDSSSMCGGSNLLNVYVAQDMESLQPCGYQSSSSSTTTTATTSSSSSSTSSSATTTTTTTTPTTTTSTTASTTTTTSSSSTTTTTSSSTTTTSSSTTTTTTTSTTNTPTTTTSTTTSSTTSTTTSTSSSTTTSGSTTSTTSSTTTTSSYTTTTSSTTSAALCTSTITLPSNCEYKCGSWCASSIPDWQDQTGCVSSYNTCAKQVTACFTNAGFPGALNCFDFASWCSNINNYCSSSCGSRSTGCSKSNCVSRYPAVSASPASTTTSVFPCSVTTSTTTTPASAATSCAPQPTNVCTQATNSKYGYNSGSPLAGIAMPLVGCNDQKSSFSSQPFKLYTNSNSNQCPSYSRSQTSNACQAACLQQYNDCQSVYVQSCKTLNRRSYFHQREAEASGIDRRWFNMWSGQSWQTASQQCTQQYNDCVSQNKAVTGSGRCTNWGTGY